MTMSVTRRYKQRRNRTHWCCFTKFSPFRRMSMRFPRKICVVVASMLVLAAVETVPTVAQTAPPTTRSQVTLVRLKPDMVNEWLDLQKNEVIPAQKKGGVDRKSVV